MQQGPIAADPTGPSAEPTRRRRRAWLACLLSLICPGLGQLYGGAARRAIGFFVAVAILDVAALIVRVALEPTLATYGLYYATAALFVVLQLYSAIDAYLLARRRGAMPLAAYQRLWVYATVLVAVFAFNFATGSVTSWNACDLPGESDSMSYSMRSRSMEPAILASDIVIAERCYFTTHDPRRGELAVFRLPSVPGVDYIKRIVGLPGDEIQMRGGVLHINGTPVRREQIEDFVEQSGALTGRFAQYIELLPDGRRHRILELSDQEPADNTPVYRLPPGYYFVLGDNRDRSLDSRMTAQFGFIPRQNLKDRPAMVIWSSDRSRIGLSVN